MNFWINLWTLFFLVSLALFGGLAVIVSIGGYFDIRSLFKTLTDSTGQESDDPGPAGSERSRKSSKDKSKTRNSKR
ncbi:hypothetical protein ACFL5Z_02825 [Planctomycetota bacterium]